MASGVFIHCPDIPVSDLVPAASTASPFRNVRFLRFISDEARHLAKHLPLRPHSSLARTETVREIHPTCPCHSPSQHTAFASRAADLNSPTHPRSGERPAYADSGRKSISLPLRYRFSPHSILHSIGVPHAQFIRASRNTCRFTADISQLPDMDIPGTNDFHHACMHLLLTSTLGKVILPRPGCCQSIFTMRLHNHGYDVPRDAT